MSHDETGKDRQQDMKAVRRTLTDLANRPRPRLEDSAEWKRIISALRDAGNAVSKMHCVGVYRAAAAEAVRYADSLVAQPENARRVAVMLLAALHEDGLRKVMDGKAVSR